jgi:hypothetical protein
MIKQDVELRDDITPAMVEGVRIETDRERIDRIVCRANELVHAMGRKYLCHPENRVKRKDGREYCRDGPTSNKVIA